MVTKRDRRGQRKDRGSREQTIYRRFFFSTTGLYLEIYSDRIIPEHVKGASKPKYKISRYNGYRLITKMLHPFSKTVALISRTIKKPMPLFPQCYI
jgi:hypothetical protein